MNPKAPSDDALCAIPGDKIDFYSASCDSGSIISGIVKSTLWQPAPKGGRIWTYELDSGELVPNLKVVKVHKCIE